MVDSSISRRKVLQTVGGSVSVGALAGCAGGGGGGSEGDGGEMTTTAQASQDQDSYTLNLAESATQESAHYRGTELLAETIEENSDGRISVDVVCCQNAGGPPEITSSVNSGTLDMGVSAVNNLANLTDAWLFVQLPYLWSDHENLYGFWSENYGDGGRGEVVERVHEAVYEDLPNIEILDYWGSNGGSMRHMHFSDDSTPVVPTDGSGQGIRVTESPIEGSTVGNWNFSSTPVAWSETTSAMQQGVVQGIHIHYWWLYASGMFEEINYTVETQTQDSPAILHINSDSWGQLPSDLQEVVTSSVAEVTPQQIEMDLEQGAEAKRMIQEENSEIEIYSPTDSELEEWQQVTEPTYDEWLGEDGVPEEFVTSALEFQDHDVPGVEL
jgi:TRAP-type C4-dicarboxylate transport system substrate-binding protein